MESYALARVIHVLCVVIWIGGVSMVTSVILPAVKKFKEPQEQLAFFEKIEQRFAWQARITTLLTALSGFYMLYMRDDWQRYLDPAHWWLHAMTLVWLLFTIVLFILEPLVLHRWFRQRVQKNPSATFSLITRFHWILLTVSLITVAAAVAGSHGWFWF